MSFEMFGEVFGVSQTIHETGRFTYDILRHALTHHDGHHSERSASVSPMDVLVMGRLCPLNPVTVSIQDCQDPATRSCNITSINCYGPWEIPKDIQAMALRLKSYRT